MKLQYIAFSLVTTLTSVYAASLPACAVECATGAIPESCSSIDPGCICSTKSFITDISCCVAQKCEPSDQQAALDYAKQICGTAGITDLPQSASCPDSPTSTEDTSAATSTTTTKAATANTHTTTQTESASVVLSSGQPTGTSSSASAGSTTTSAETSSDTETPSASATPDAAPIVHGKEIGLLAAIAGAVAFIV